MEKHLGWIVGGVGALLVGAMVPVVAFASPINSGSINAQTSGTTVSEVETTATTNTTNTTSAATSNDAEASQTPGVQTTLAQKIKYVDKVATNAVGGGTVTNTTIDNAGTGPVWTVTVQQPSGGSYQVQISAPSYTVLATQQVK